MEENLSKLDSDNVVDWDFNRSDILLKSTPNLMKIIREYYQLRVLPNLSEQQAERIGKIMELATTDRVVDFWIIEVEHALGHALNLLDESCRYSYQDQQALLREYLGTGAICTKQYQNLSNILRDKSAANR